MFCTSYFSTFIKLGSFLQLAEKKRIGYPENEYEMKLTGSFTFQMFW